MIWIKIAARNLLKNARRSTFAILAVGLGFAAVNIFGGFTSYVYESLRETFIHAKGNGHLSIFKQGFLTEGKLESLGFLLDEEEVRRIEQEASRIPGFKISTRQLHINGLISNGEVSTIFLGVGIIPSRHKMIQGGAAGVISKLKLFNGEPLRDDRPYSAGLGRGLASQLRLTLDSDAIVTAPTVEGHVNALDLRVAQLFSAGGSFLNDKLIVVPLEFAQLLYDTTSVDRVNILLEDHRLTREYLEQLTAIFSSAGMDVEVKSWEELSDLYTKARDMFNVMFSFLFVIVFLIAAMSVVNTIGMAVMERIREIGTLRALGANRSKLIKLFALESGLLGLFGTALGLLLTLLAAKLIDILKVTWIPPNFVTRIPIEVELVAGYLFFTAVVFLSLTVCSAIPPVRRAFRRDIVDTLGHV